MSPRGESETGQTAAIGSRQRRSLDPQHDDGLAQHLQAHEAVAFSFSTSRSVERETAAHIDLSGQQTVDVAVTGKRTLLVGGPADVTIAIPHTAVDSARYERRLIRRWFVIDTDEETYRFVPEDGDSPTAAVEYIRQATWAWRDAARTFEDARECVTALGNALEAGDDDQARRERHKIHRALQKGRAAAESADVAGDAIRAEADVIDTERARTEVRTRLARASEYERDASDHREAREYTAAHAALRNAREHVESARSIAAEYDFREQAAIPAESDHLSEQLSKLEREPLLHAEAACQELTTASGPVERVEALQTALDETRTALLAGWGIEDAAFEGDTDTLRMQISWLVATLLEAYPAYVDHLEDVAADQRPVDEDKAIETYDRAADALQSAIDLAREYRQGDPEPLAQRLADIERTRAELEWEWGGT